MASPALRLSELLASLSLATDLALGEPLGHGLRTSLLAVSLAHELGVGDEEVRSVQQVALLRFLGCTSDAAETARMTGGDDMSFNARMAPSVSGGMAETMMAFVGAVGAGQPPLRRARLVVAALADPGAGRETLIAHCEVAAMLARRLGVGNSVLHSLSHAYERWDGKGLPAGLSGDQVPIEVRIAEVARDVDLFHRRGADVAPILRRRRGKAYDPDVVDAYQRLGPAHPEAVWEDVIAAEPSPPALVSDLDEALAAVADFVDVKSRWTRGHSPRVAELAAAAARSAGLEPEEVRELQRAALVHDVGRVGVENGVWDKPGPLVSDEWEKVRTHPYLTQRILGRCPALAGLGELAASHHERLNGGGYHRALSSEHLSTAARILAAADVMAALTAARPHRPEIDQEAAVAAMNDEVAAGSLDADAVRWVAAAAGAIVPPRHEANPGGLTDREIEVLTQLAAGHTNREMGERLFISPKTVGRHVENIYSKIGVSTRAAAAVYAMQHRLLG